MERRVGNYTILEEIGRGGMGSVRRTLDGLLLREIATKTLVPSAAGGLGTRAGAARVTPPRQARLNVAIAVLMAFLVVISMARPVPLSDEKFPPIAALQGLAAGNVFHGPAVGGVMIYELWPERRVFVDDRAELYGAEAFAEVVDSWEATRYREVFATHDITQAIVKQEQALAGALREDGWEVRYEDETWLVFGRPR